MKNLFFFSLLFLLCCAACDSLWRSDVVGERTLRTGWFLASSKAVGNEVEEVVRHTDSQIWLPAKVPGTVLGSLVEAGVYENPFYGQRMDSIPREPFEVPWWYKTTFDIQDVDTAKEVVMLQIDGLNYRADIWLNGKRIATQDTVFGAFRQFSLSVERYLQPKGNELLIKVSPPEVRDFYMGFVDWAPMPPDHFMGVFRDIRLKRSGKVSLDDAFFYSDFDPSDSSQAQIKALATLHNFSEQEQEVVLHLQLASSTMQVPIHLRPNALKTIRLDSLLGDELTIKSPKLWWPNGLGKPNLYQATLSIESSKGQLLDRIHRSFGIRKIETYVDDSDVRHYKINGRPLLIKGAGWVDDLFLRFQPKKDSAQIAYVKDMHLNALRFEGVWGNNQHLYDLCDQNGILLMVGWSCQWEWPDYLGLPLNMKPGDENLPINEGVDRYAIKLKPSEKTLLATYFSDQVKWLRNHPSIFTWVGGSDAMPPPDLEARYRDTLAKYDPTRPFLISAGAFKSKISGSSGMKMNGPYQYVPPVYWYEDQKLGGAYGFNSEVGPGPQLPPLSSIKKMMPTEDLWPPDNAMWNYHSGRKDFSNLSIYLKALRSRYGESDNIEELTYKAQLLNYELIRPMFEAHVIHRKKASGVIQWMLNSPWPEFYWQLYDYYLMPNGGYFGAKIALQPMNLIYDYQKKSVFASNDTRHPIQHCTAAITLYDCTSHVRFQQRINLDGMDANTVKNLLRIPPVEQKQGVNFLDLRIIDSQDNVLARNFYWLGTQMDELDWSVYSWFYTPTKQYADFSALNRLPQAEIKLEREIYNSSKGTCRVDVKLTNTSPFISFGNQLQLLDPESHEPILPVTWSDNYFSLLPHESRVIECHYQGKKNAEIQLQSMNGKLQNL